MFDFGTQSGGYLHPSLLPFEVGADLCRLSWNKRAALLDMRAAVRSAVSRFGLRATLRSCPFLWTDLSALGAALTTAARGRLGMQASGL